MSYIEETTIPQSYGIDLLIVTWTRESSTMGSSTVYITMGESTVKDSSTPKTEDLHTKHNRKIIVNINDKVYRNKLIVERV